MHIAGKERQTISALFGELAHVNRKLDSVALKRLDVEVETLKLDRFASTGEQRLRMAEDQLERMNLDM